MESWWTTKQRSTPQTFRVSLPGYLLRTLQREVQFLTCSRTGGRGFVKRKDELGTETVYAVSAMHQLRCLVR